ncbi:hypothetical protein [Paraburkholderia graminis]|uniref:hypothetical protein n=1 Tax=Paraburkholderia graminis TaxID=60548 RepID=UPI0038BD5541
MQQAVPNASRSCTVLWSRYYAGLLLFSLFFPLFFAMKHRAMLLALPVHLQVVLVLNTLLYPYARFVCDSVTGYIIRDTVIIFPLPEFAIFGVFSVLFCCCFAILSPQSSWSGCISVLADKPAVCERLSGQKRFFADFPRRSQMSSPKTTCMAA